jgi:hypothetical protein
MDGKPTFDLQSHSVHSDGALAPAEVVARAAAAGVKVLALSDHDGIGGVIEAIEAGAEMGVHIVPAVEITAVDEQHDDIHLLGYLINHTDPNLVARLEAAQEERLLRGRLMASRLEGAGWQINHAFLDKVEASGATVGRPHVAQALLSDPENTERLAELGLTTTGQVIHELLQRGKEAFVPRDHPTVEEAIGWVHDAGGVAVYAHPFFPAGRYGRDAVEEAVRRYAAIGLDGVECFYITHSEEDTRFLHGLAMELGLLTTGSADFHGPDHGDFNVFREFELYGLEVNLGPILPAA